MTLGSMSRDLYLPNTTQMMEWFMVCGMAQLTIIRVRAECADDIDAGLYADRNRVWVM